MSKLQLQLNRSSSFGHRARRSFVSTFVVAAYVAYALHERFASPSATVLAQAPQPDQPPSSQNQANSQPTQPSSPLAQVAPADPPPAQPASLATQLPLAQPQAGGAQPTQPASHLAQPTSKPVQPTPKLALPVALPTPIPQIVSQGPYKNGTYTGAVESAFYGQVQVRVVIQNGAISQVQFLTYPQDRRTSQRINSVAVPRLQTEAIKAQSAKVSIVSGATLTSEAFIASLQTALSSARS